MEERNRTKVEWVLTGHTHNHTDSEMHQWEIGAVVCSVS